jgi:hypothetical protein
MEIVTIIIININFGMGWPGRRAADSNEAGREEDRELSMNRRYKGYELQHAFETDGRYRWSPPTS